MCATPLLRQLMLSVQLHCVAAQPPREPLRSKLEPPKTNQRQRIKHYETNHAENRTATINPPLKSEFGGSSNWQARSHVNVFGFVFIHHLSSCRRFFSSDGVELGTERSCGSQKNARMRIDRCRFCYNQHAGCLPSRRFEGDPFRPAFQRL